MPSLPEISEPPRSSGQTRSCDGDCRRRPESISPSCHTLLEKAEALGLDLHDVIDAVRRCAASPRSFN